jgi:hypothetical protein
MTAFEELQNTWNQQRLQKAAPLPEELLQKAKQHERHIKAKHRWTIAVLSVTTIGLVWLLRVLLEYASYRQFNRIDTGASFNEYTSEITRFYLRRKTIHYILTPVLMLAYITGFVCMLPVFKQQLSHGFYLYVLVSGTLFFIIISWMIAVQVQKEIKLLRFLQTIE